MVNKKVIYTSVFGCSEENNYHLHNPDVKLKGYDFVCFTDNTNFKSDVVVNDIKIYQINSNEFQDRTTQNTPVAGKMRDFLSQNDYSTPEAGITSIRSESSGFAGLVKTTTIEFKVFNYFDFD